MIKTWKKIKEEPYKSGYRKMVKRVFEMPNGKIAEYDLINGGAPVCVFAVTKDQKVILVRQFRPAQERLLLELPGGGIEKGETPEQAAKRELSEETGYTGEFHFLGKSLQSAYDTLVRHNFIAVNCEKIQNTTDFEFEETEPVEMTIEEFKKHLHSCELTDVATGYMGLEYLKL